MLWFEYIQYTLIFTAQWYQFIYRAVGVGRTAPNHSMPNENKCRTQYAQRKPYQCFEWHFETVHSGRRRMANDWSVLAYTVRTDIDLKRNAGAPAKATDAAGNMMPNDVHTNKLWLIIHRAHAACQSIRCRPLQWRLQFNHPHNTQIDRCKVHAFYLHLKGEPRMTAQWHSIEKSIHFSGSHLFT